MRVSSRLWAAHLLGLGLLLLLESNARADTLVVSGDAFLNFASPSANHGGSDHIRVNAGPHPTVGLVRFDRTPLPSGVSLAKVTLRLWVNSVTEGGTVRARSCGAIGGGEFARYRSSQLSSRGQRIHSGGQTTYACNGAPGAQGPAGTPGADGAVVNPSRSRCCAGPR